MKSATAALILAFTSATIASPANFRRADCQAAYDACRIAPDANMSYCAAQNAQCLAGSSSASATAISTFSSISGIPGGCNPAHPGSCPSSTSTFSSISGIPGGCNPAHPGSCPTSTASSASASSTASSSLPLGATCDPSIENQCANGVQCYSTNYMLMRRCGNFQASCSSDSQCAFNTCNGGLCNGFLPSSSYLANTATKTVATTVITNTATTITKPVTETHVAGTVTEVKTFTTTYCPKSTVTIINTAAPTGIPGGCNPAHPGSCPTATSVAAAPGNTGEVTNLPGWTVENLIRYCNAQGTGCDYNFGIDNGNGFKQNCTISTSNSNINESFYNKVCTDGSSYRVSWGYSDQFGADNAFATLTIDDIQSKTRAFFGVADVNSKPVTASSPKGSGNFGNIGPQPVYPIN